MWVSSESESCNNLAVGLVTSYAMFVKQTVEYIWRGSVMSAVFVVIVIRVVQVQVSETAILV